MFDYDRFLPRADELRREFQAAWPFPHLVLDDFANVEALKKALAVFPRPTESIAWQRFDSPKEKKLAFCNTALLKPPLSGVLHELNSSSFLALLERLTGITSLLADPDFVGGGIHQIERGGYLGIHADFNYHPKTRWDRRLNLLLYLNLEWREEFGGHLELWDAELKRSKRILPIFNRMVCFATGDATFHGHPQPLQCPSEWTRKSLALYYYTKGRPRAERSFPHSTLFQTLPKGEGQGSF